MSTDEVKTHYVAETGKTYCGRIAHDSITTIEKDHVTCTRCLHYIALAFPIRKQPKIHYLESVTGYPYCGNPGYTSATTLEKERVTCTYCLRRMSPTIKEQPKVHYIRESTGDIYCSNSCYNPATTSDKEAITCSRCLQIMSQANAQYNVDMRESECTKHLRSDARKVKLAPIRRCKTNGCKRFASLGYAHCFLCGNHRKSDY